MIGQPVLRREDRRFLMGPRTIRQDVPHRVRAVHGRRAEPARARADRARSTSTGRRRLPGVIGAFRLADLPELRGALPPPVVPAVPVKPYRQSALADGVARFAGEPVVAVVADRSLSRPPTPRPRSASTYEPLPAAIDPVRAADDPGARSSTPTGAPTSPPPSASRPAIWTRPCGARAVVVTRRIRCGRLTALPMEPRAVRRALGCRHREPAPLVEHADAVRACASASPRRWALEPRRRARDGARRRRRVRHQGPGLSRRSSIVATLARRLGRPVRWTDTRQDSFVSTTHAGDQLHDVTLALGRRRRDPRARRRFPDRRRGLPSARRRGCQCHRHAPRRPLSRPRVPLPRARRRHPQGAVRAVPRRRAAAGHVRRRAHPRHRRARARSRSRRGSPPQPDPRRGDAVPAQPSLPRRRADGPRLRRLPEASRRPRSIAAGHADVPRATAGGATRGAPHRPRRRRLQRGHRRSGRTKARRSRVEESGRVRVTVGAPEPGPGPRDGAGPGLRRAARRLRSGRSTSRPATPRASRSSLGTYASRIAVIVGNAVALAADAVRERVAARGRARAGVRRRGRRGHRTGARTSRALRGPRPAPGRGRSRSPVGPTSCASSASPASPPRATSARRASRGRPASTWPRWRWTPPPGASTCSPTTPCTTPATRSTRSIVEGQTHGGAVQGIGAALSEAIVYDDAGPAPHREPDGVRDPARRRRAADRRGQRGFAVAAEPAARSRARAKARRCPGRRRSRTRWPTRSVSS